LSAVFKDTFVFVVVSTRLWHRDTEIFQKSRSLLNILGPSVQNFGGHAVAHLVEALCYKPEGRGFDSHWCQWNFSLTKSFQPHYGVDSASNRNEYQVNLPGGKGCRCVGLATLQPLCADCLEIWEPQPSGSLRTCPGL
jgi:hypothetical protein